MIIVPLLIWYRYLPTKLLFCFTVKVISPFADDGVEKANTGKMEQEFNVIECGMDSIIVFWKRLNSGCKYVL